MSTSLDTLQAAQVIGGDSLKARLASAERRNKIRAFLLVVPLLLFLGVTFFGPIASMIGRGFEDPLLPDNLPLTLEALADWDPSTSPLPPDKAFRALGEEMLIAHKAHLLGRVATRLNYAKGGMRSLVTKSGRKIKRLAKAKLPADDKAWRTALLKVDKRWGKTIYWATIKNVGHRYTLNFYLRSFDLGRDLTGAITKVVENQRLYFFNGANSVWQRTIWISFLVTAFCVLLGYPVAYLLATLPLRTSNLLMILVLLPFWTSLLVRTTAWIVVLQSEGVLNNLLIFLGLIDHRVQLIFNRFGVVVSMTHILLPFMILPIYSVMKNISPSYVRAARSLGANPFSAFWRVYFPQSVPGIGAGGLLVYILALGYYITPALVGGPKDQLVSYFIADHTTHTLNWGLAAALGGILLVGVLIIYAVYDRLVGIDNMKLG